jgi:hypothetical protein
VPDRLVTRADGTLAYANTPEQVDPPAPFPARFRVKPDRCDQGTRYRWLVDGAEVGVLRGTCEFEHHFPREGEYDVRLEMTGPDGERSGEQRIRIEDWLVVSIGDSVASGEGNPDRSAARGRWHDASSHRSGQAGHAQAALALERRDPTTSVTFVHLACSGAGIEVGLLGEYAGIDPPPGGRKHEPQVTQLHEVGARAGRDIDAILLSIGANDAYFGPAAIFCITFPDCADRRFDPKRPFRLIADRRAEPLRQVVRGRIAALPGLYAQVDAALGEELSERVHVVEYFDPTHRSGGRFCRILGISRSEAEFAFESILEPLNDAVATAARRHEWKLVAGAEEEFRDHGYCVRGRGGWVVTLGRSLRLNGLTRPQVATSGTLHPNERGHQAIKALVLASLTDELPEGPGEDDGGGEDDVEGWGIRLLLALAGLAAMSALLIALLRRRRRRQNARERRAAPPLPPPTSLGQRRPRAEDGSSARPPGDRSPPLLRLFNASGRWVHRRVESVTFFGVDLVRRYVRDRKSVV